jgi:hypothetical protein
MEPPDRRSICQYCKRGIEQTGNGPYSTRKIGVSGTDLECASAPNPDDGPMPYHVPTVIVERPTEWPISIESPVQLAPPQIPWIPVSTSHAG